MPTQETARSRGEFSDFGCSAPAYGKELILIARVA